jgi:hypothetical protein
MMAKWVPGQRGQRICAIVTMLDAQNDAHVARSGKDVLQWTPARGLHKNDDPNGMGRDYLIESYIL